MATQWPLSVDRVKSRVLPLHVPLDLRLTLGVLRDGAGDPCLRLLPADAVRATRTPEGPATIELHVRGAELEARAWGPGAIWALDHVGDLVGLHDDDGCLRPAHRLVRHLLVRLAGLRQGRTLAVFETLVPAIIGQRVTGREAGRSYWAIVGRYGEWAPGPHRLKLPPAADLLASLGYHALHPLGIERQRAETLRRAAVEAPRLERRADSEPALVLRRLRAIRGIGVWTTSHVARTAFGDPDAVILGDWNLPHTVAYALAGEERATDERMLELLAPYPGQRGRIQRLIATACGPAPRRGPRRPLRNLTRI
jgi:3-methyladenine DNA glycosylase/8-oxoguanine DNA glycosylase